MSLKTQTVEQIAERANRSRERSRARRHIRSGKAAYWLLMSMMGAAILYLVVHVVVAIFI